MNNAGVNKDVAFKKEPPAEIVLQYQEVFQDKDTPKAALASISAGANKSDDDGNPSDDNKAMGCPK